MTRDAHAIWVPGPRWKVIGVNQCKGVVGHSAVGYKTGLMDRINSQDNVGWQYSILYDGTIWQHYEDEEWVWHGHGASPFAIGIEHEGGYNPENEPLRPAQLAASIGLVRRLSERHGFKLERHNGLWEHNEFAQKPCPSGRIPWEQYTAAPAPMPAPFAAFHYRGPGDQPWQYDYELRIQTTQVAPNLQTTYEGRQGADEVYRIRVEDWT